MSTSPLQATTDARTRGSLIAAALVALFMLVAITINVVGLAIMTFGYSNSFDIAMASTQSYGLQVFTQIVPIAVGVVIGFRRVPGIQADLTLRQVLVRSVITAAISAVLSFAVSLVWLFINTFTGSFFANSFPFSDVSRVFGNAFGEFGSTIGQFVQLVPLVALAAVLLWLWLRRRAAASVA